MISDLLAARLTMAISLGFHIIFASISMVLPFLMVGAYRKYLKTSDKDYLHLTRFWLRGTAILFAIGAVSGTILSFELGLLWPGFMEHAGPIIGMPFSLEGAAFFIEAIAIGLFIYGWGKLPDKVHLGFGFLVGVSGVLSGVLVVSANGWMNSPSGFEYVNGAFVNIDPVKAMFNDAWLSQALHMIMAAFMATCFGVAGVHAWLLRKHPEAALHQKALKLAVVPACIAALLMPISGDFSAKSVAERQPLKLAAMEAHFHTEPYADLIVGGIPDMDDKRVDYALKIPGALSFLATGSFSEPVQGLLDFPEEEWPPVPVTHAAFQVMVGIGMVLAAFSLKLLWDLKRSRLMSSVNLLGLIGASPLGFIAIEAGWIVTEVGRQPWIIYNVMKTADAVTPVPNQAIVFYAVTVMYVVLSFTVIWLMKRQFSQSEPE